MFLDMYYRIPCYNALVRSIMTTNVSYQAGINVPEYKTADGVTRSAYWSNGGTSASTTYGAHVGYGYPINSILSQKSTLTGTYMNLYSNIIVGSGTTPVTSSDFQLEEEITTGLSSPSITREWNATEGYLTYRKNMTNSSDTELTISEIGLTWGVIPTAATTYYQVLVYREVLDTPLVVQPGETFTVSVTHQFTMPT